MKLVFIEDYGNFNWAVTDEYSTYWKIVIKDNEGKTLKVDEVDCVLEWREEGDERGRWSMSDEMTEMARQSFDYEKKWFISTTDYKARTLAFIATYNEHKDELITNWETDRKTRIQKEIENLQHQLDRTEIYDELIDKSSIVSKEIVKLQNWIESCTAKLEQYKEGSDLRSKEMKTIESYQSQLKKLLQETLGEGKEINSIFKE